MSRIVARACFERARRSIPIVADRITAVGPALAAGVVMSQIALAQGDPALDAKVTAFVNAFTASAGVPLDPGGNVVTQFVDLNGDGTAEALVTLDSPSWCGSRGCSSFVLDLRGTSAVSLGDYTAIDFQPLDSQTGQWRDISVNGHRQVFRGGQYGPP